MSDERPQPDKKEFRSQNKDIVPLLKGWDYEPGTINVRKIHGADGSPKLQMRLNLGVLQMEMSGRPDGTRPHGCESLLDYHEEQLREHEDRHGTDLGFHLTSSQCQSLRDEAALYYHRYLSLLVLEEYPAVVRDTARNLRVLDLCGKYAMNEQDRLELEQYRPYITMINARAQASILSADKRYTEALEVVNNALQNIKEFFIQFGQEEAFDHSSEVKNLKKYARDIRRKLPVDPIEKLQAQLQKAVKREEYEEAARIRDEIARKTTTKNVDA